MAALNVSNMLSSLLEPADDAGKQKTGVDFSGKSLSMNTAEDVRDLVAAIQSCPEGELRSLNLSGNSLGVEAAGALGDALARRPELTHAHWADLFTGRMKTEIPQALCSLGAGMMSAKIQLTVLDLSDNAFGPIGVGGLADLLKSSVCTFLQELRLNNNGIGITGAKLLVEALQPMPVHLEVLEMGRNRLENVGAQALSTIIQNLPKLRVLRIPQNGVYLPGVTALCAALAQGCPRLTWLDLNDNTVGPRGAQVLADTLPSLPRLANLNLGDCLLKTRGAIAILDAIGCLEELEDLNLSFDEIGPRALPSLQSALTGRSKTVRAELGGNSLGAAAKRDLAAVPGVRLATQDGDDSDMDDDDHESEEESESDGGSDSGASSCSDDVKEDPLAGAHDGTAYDDNDEAINLSSYSNNEDPTGAVARSPVGIFLCNPSADNLKVLGAEADEIIKEHIQSQVDDMSHLDTAMALVMGLGGLGETTSAGNVLRALVNWAEQGSGRRWILANSILTHLELIKSEKKYSLRWDRTRCVEAFALFVTQAWFPAELKDTLTFFVKLHVDDPKKAKLFDFTKYPQLYKNI